MKPIVVHITRSILAASGAARFMYNLMRSLDDYDHKLLCAFPSKKTKGGHRENVAAFCVLPTTNEVPLPSYRLRKWVSSLLQRTFPTRLVKTLGKIGASLVHSHYPNRIDLQAIAVLQKAKLPMVWTIHALPPDNEKELIKWQLGIDLIIRSGCGRVIAISKAVVQRMVKLGICKPEDVQVIYNGIDLNRFINIHQKRLIYRLELGFPENVIVFGAVGRLNYEKGHDIFIEAAKLLLKKVKSKNILFAIAGSGPLAEELNSKIKLYGLEHCFRLVGYMPDVRPFLSALDVFVFPSRKEGFGLALLEALASGLPCIATSVGGIPEVLGEDGGLLVPPESPEALAEAMYEMLSPERRQKFATHSQEIARKFPLEACAKQYARIYEELISQKGV